MNRLLRHPAALVFLFALTVPVALIHIHPAIFGGDTVLRLANRDKVLLAYQLPVLQFAIHAISQVFTGVLAVRYFMAAVGALAAVGFYKLAADFMDSRAALTSAMLFASSPFLVQLSIVPYQEIPMLAALLFAFHFFVRRRSLAASACFGLACLTRYEAWAAAPALALGHFARSGRGPRAAFQAIALFGWAPLAWIILHQGFSAPGTFVIEMPASAARLMRYVYLGWITVKNTPAPVLILAVWGGWILWKAGLRKQPDLRVPLAFLILFAAAILISAHGEAPDPERFVTAREAHIPIAAAVFAAGFAIRQRRRAGAVLAAAGVVLGLYQAHRFTARDTSLPATRLSFELARYLDAAVRDGEAVAMLVKPIPEPLVRNYLDKVEAASGEEGLRRARRVLASVDTSPPDYQRTKIHAARGGQLVSFAPRPGRAAPEPAVSANPDVEWIVVWSDHMPGNETEARLLQRAFASGEPVRVLSSGPLAVNVYRTPP
jgi:hypothetical protein